MTAFVLRRLGQALLTILAVTVIFFFAFRLIPYNFGQLVAGQNATPRQDAAFARDPAIIQYLHIMDSWLHGDFGYRVEYGRSIARLLLDALPPTAVLVLSALVLTMIVGIPLGAVQAIKRSSVLDRACGVLAIVASATPVMFSAFVLVDWLSLHLELFPATGPPSTQLGVLLTDYRAMVLPVVVIALPQIGRFSQLMRSTVWDQLGHDYVRTARANGVGPGRLFTRHILRNAMVPILTYLGVALPAVLSATLIVEALFNIQGLGYFLWQAAIPKNLYFDVEFAVLFVMAIGIALAQALVDILLLVVDPRIAR